MGLEGFLGLGLVVSGDVADGVAVEVRRRFPVFRTIVLPRVDDLLFALRPVATLLLHLRPVGLVRADYVVDYVAVDVAVEVRHETREREDRERPLRAPLGLHRRVPS